MSTMTVLLSVLPSVHCRETFRRNGKLSVWLQHLQLLIQGSATLASCLSGRAELDFTHVYPHTNFPRPIFHNSCPGQLYTDSLHSLQPGPNPPCSLLPRTRVTKVFHSTPTPPSCVYTNTRYSIYIIPTHIYRVRLDYNLISVVWRLTWTCSNGGSLSSRTFQRTHTPG